MEFIFIRHGHGEHLLDYPNRLNILHPELTPYGVHQINQLRNQIEIFHNDLVLVSPTKRTIQSAELLLRGKEFIISPFVGPRMYPQNPEYPFLLCDQIYSRNEIMDLKVNATILDFGFTEWGDGINRIQEAEFESIGYKTLEWCYSNGSRTYIISHDGTITNYRMLLGEKELTRKDFLGEAGIYKTSFEVSSKRT